MRKYLMTIAVMCFAMFLQAQELPRVTSDTIKEISLDDITIAATRFSENKNKIAQQVQTISASKIKFLNQQTTAELLTHSGHVQVQKSQLGGGSPVIRGFEANKVLISIDGVRLNNAVFRGGHLQNVITMDNAILDRTEILFGPSSVMYGSDALGGVISFYTKKPAFSNAKKKVVFGGNAFVRYSSAYNEKTGHADFTVSGNKLSSLTSFTISDFDDLKQGSKYYDDFPDWGKRTFYVERINGIDSMVKNSNVNKQVGSGYTQYDLLQKFRMMTGNVEHVFNFQYSTSSDINRYDRLTEVNGSGIARSAEWYYGPQKRMLVSWNLSLPKTGIYDKATITPAFQDIEESRHNRNYRSTKLNHRIEKIRVLSLNADFWKNINKTELGYGLELTHNKVNSTANAVNISTGVVSSLDTRYPDGGSTTQSYAAYLTAIHKLSDKWVLNGGARVTHNRLESKFIDKSFFPFPYDKIEQTPTAVSGNLGVVYLPGSGWKIAALAATGFRTPNVDDMAKVFESGGGTLIVPNPNIKPEKTINYELTISKTVANKLQAAITGWYTDYHDALTTDFSTFNGSSSIEYNGTTSRVVTVVNKKKAYVYGVSGNVGVDFNKHLSFSTVLNYTYGRIKEEPEDYPLDHVAPVFGKTSVTGRFGKFTGELFALYNGAKDSANYNLRGEDNQVYSADQVRGFTPGWVTANFRSSYDINRYATVQFAVENIFDKFYRVFSSGLSAPGRNFVLTLRARL